ncbi:MAG: metal-binding protein [Sphaerospermopsis sp. SIO1G2]|nr:metal-binding protein [Sphaerospermopsis sp. SIO1G1]NET70604.1 metal-binding protein [Sphaerospermopsis sp. SIO1G2]
MPSGQTHDRITIWSVPLVAGVTLAATGSSGITLLVSGGFMFGGLMFGPDLDIYSRQFQRWGFLRWIWLPYQKSLRHRSFLSHGPIIGTTLRVVYLTTFLSMVGIVTVVLFARLANLAFDWEDVWLNVGKIISAYYGEFWAGFVGCELGAMSHSLSDWTNSAYKRYQKQGIQAILPSSKVKRRKTSSRPVKKRSATARKPKAKNQK